MTERVNETMLLIMERVDDVRCWRQNTGKLPDLAGRWVQFGVPGMADIGGIAGPCGWFFQIEMKAEKAHRNKKTIERQKRWRTMIEKHGGIYILAVSPSQAVEMLIDALEEKRRAA